MNNKVISCGIGWARLYKPIVSKILEFDDKQESSNKKIGIKSISSVDGRLVITLENKENVTPEIANDIEKASLDSLRVCEVCGESDNVGTTMNNEYITCCRLCWEKVILPVKSNSIWKDYSTNKTYRKKV